MRETLRPIRLGKLRRIRRLSRRINRNQRTLLPLEQITRPQTILTLSVELHRSLHTLERIARMQLVDERGIIDAVNFGRCLNQNLSHSVAFCHVRADVIGFATVLRQEVVNHLRVLEGVDLRVPAAIRHEDSLRGSGATNSLGKLRALVRSRCRYQGLWIVRSEEHTSELQSPCNLVC